MAHRIEAIFFDIDDTIFSTTDFAAQARRNSVRAMIDAGLRADEETCLAELEEVIREFSTNYEHHFDKLLLRLPPSARGGVNPLVLVAAGMVGYHDTKFRDLSPHEDAIEVLRTLRERDALLGVVTEGIGIKQAEKVVRLGLHEYVDPKAIFISDSIGISKSNPKLFIRACETVGVAPEHAMYVGDRPAVDVDTPKKVGMRAVLQRRGGRYSDQESESAPDHVIHNFFDLLELLDAEYELAAPAAPTPDMPHPHPH